MQPSVKAAHRGISYREFRPSREVEDFIYCFWQLRTTAPLEAPFVYRVVSDGCIDIFFDHHQVSESYIMGFCRKFTEFPIGREFDYIGIRFLPSAFPLLFGIDAKALSNQAQKVDGILPEISSWINKHITPQNSVAGIVELLDGMLGEKIRNQKFDFDSRFFSALNLIFQKRGCLETESDLDTGLSSRQLRRLFNFYIGTTPKAFSKVVRFQQILNAKPSKQSLKEDKLFYELGFYDQAHFIKDFKVFYGVTPKVAFG